MKYFIDTEFITGFKKRPFYKRSHKSDFFIDLISIALVAEDGRIYYAISNEYNYNDADDWVKKNVILPLYIETVHGDSRNRWDSTDFHKLYGKPNSQIAKEIIEFINPNLQELIDTYTRHDSWMEVYYPKEFAYINAHSTKIPSAYYKSGSDGYVKNRAFIYNQPEFYGYYADYDWVVFCSLFGRMIDLPKGFPMYCRDLKQMLDENYIHQENKYPHETRLESWLKAVKIHPEYPKQENEHSALDDAKWNKDLYYFISQKKFLNKSENKAAKIK